MYQFRDIVEALANEIKKRPAYWSGEDDLESPYGIVEAAIMVIGRMGEDLDAVKRERIARAWNGDLRAERHAAIDKRKGKE